MERPIKFYWNRNTKEENGMPDTLFQGIFDTQLTAVIAPEQFLLCVGASLVIGLVL